MTHAKAREAAGKLHYIHDDWSPWYNGNGDSFWVQKWLAHMLHITHASYNSSEINGDAILHALALRLLSALLVLPSILFALPFPSLHSSIALLVPVIMGTGMGNEHTCKMDQHNLQLAIANKGFSWNEWEQLLGQQLENKNATDLRKQAAAQKACRTVIRIVRVCSRKEKAKEQLCTFKFHVFMPVAIWRWHAEQWHSQSLLKCNNWSVQLTVMS